MKVSHVEAAHTADTLKEELKAVLDNWSLPSSSLVGITTDNASNIIKATAELGLFIH